MNAVPATDAPPVRFDTRAAANGTLIGIATLDAPRTLNGLSLDMARLLDAQLAQWADDARIAMVVLEGAGEKAFCAGGDLHGLYRSMVEFRASGATDIRDNAYASDFFAVEYRLDHRIHTYPKPVLCWGHGIVMGGGIGLMAGASHRVVTERSKLAFPEITVGLYPDVGGSWLLARVPDRGGLFLALTGAPLDAGDAIRAGLADHHVAQAHGEEVYDALLRVDWQADAAANREALTALLRSYAQTPAAGPLERHAALVASVCAHDDLDDVVAAIAAIDTDDAWLSNAKTTLAAGSPGSARLGFALQCRAKSLSLADTFRLEYVASLRCAAHGDFAEGIRALLVDKDRAPRWNPATLAAASAAWAEPFFVAPWPADAHPLADLGRTPTEISA
jgi:enoyl-CoA hydratase/carnithine racemase